MRPSLGDMEEKYWYQVANIIRKRVLFLSSHNNESEFIQFIQEIALKSTLFEVAATPKPGLVDRNNSGAHKDMDFFTFMASSAILPCVFTECARQGLSYSSSDFQGLLKKLRPIGVEAEKRMLQATAGVNTHKGLIFSLGIICAAAGSIYRDTGCKVIMCREISDRVKKMTSGISDRELKGTENNKRMTTGERLYNEHGVKGIRGQIESGFSAVTDKSLVVFKEMLRQGSLSLNDTLVQVLLHLMTVTEDSNVIGRHGMAMLDYVKKCANDALSAGGMLTKAGKKYICQMDRDFVDKGISPGGSADLLAVTIMLHLLENHGAK